MESQFARSVLHYNIIQTSLTANEKPPGLFKQKNKGCSHERTTPLITALQSLLGKVLYWETQGAVGKRG